MNTKEAIKLLNKYIEHPWSIEIGNEDADKFKEVINLLKRGEKCCKIIEGLRNIDANISIFSKSNETISMTALDVYLDEIDKEIK